MGGRNAGSWRAIRIERAARVALFRYMATAVSLRLSGDGWVSWCRWVWLTPSALPGISPTRGEIGKTLYLRFILVR